MGVDVGGERKGFDVAVLDADRVVHLSAREGVADVVSLVARFSPTIIAVDSPRSCAPAGHNLREGERRLRAAVCGIRWTPARERLDGNPYYGWVLHGLRLYDALAASNSSAEVIECFPTASWTRWHGPRGSRSRADWSTAALAALKLAGVPPRTTQDQRDAIGAAATAGAYAQGHTESFEEIVVPLPRSV